jgi:hypothetical protein
MVAIAAGALPHRRADSVTAGWGAVGTKHTMSFTWRCTRVQIQTWLLPLRVPMTALPGESSSDCLQAWQLPYPITLVPEPHILPGRQMGHRQHTLLPVPAVARLMHHVATRVEVQPYALLNSAACQWALACNTPCPLQVSCIGC